MGFDCASDSLFVGRFWSYCGLHGSVTERKRKREEYLVVSYLVGERSRSYDEGAGVLDTQRPGYSEGVTELVIFH